MTRRSIADEEGSAAIEFALTAPLFLSLVAGIAGMGLLMWAQIGLQHAVEMAARCGSVDRELCSTETAIQNYAVTQAAALNPSASIFEVSSQACGMRVIARYPFTHVTDLLGVPPITITAQHCFPR